MRKTKHLMRTFRLKIPMLLIRVKMMKILCRFPIRTTRLKKLTKLLFLTKTPMKTALKHLTTTAIMKNFRPAGSTFFPILTDRETLSRERFWETADFSVFLF